MVNNERDQSASKNKGRDSSEVQEASPAPPKTQEACLPIELSTNSPSHKLGMVQAPQTRTKLGAESEKLTGLCRWFYSTSSVDS